MTNKITLQEKLKMVMERTGMKATEIAQATELPKESMYKWLKGTRPSDSVVYDKLERYLDSILERVLGDDAPVKYNAFFERTSTLKIPLKRSGKAVPLTTAIASPGTIAILNNEPQLIVDRIDAPFMGEVEGMIQMIGESMEPTFKHGCRIAISRLKNPEVLNWGDYYFIIDINWRGTIRRVYQGATENTIQLISDNEDQSKYPPIIRPFDQIEAIFQVKGGFMQYS